ncbi:MAG TPA: hypothetical protein ENO10_04345 [Salinimicrobium catena]|uniref:TTHB210-like domain-containing protein n=1 Tax=Salinimicrobium catena TaxID=390640 RepID=A0A7C2RCW2_9FLAO|nr:hypothetical protein [Salinimicrobium catena]
MKKLNFFLSPRSFSYLLLFLLFVFSACEKEAVNVTDDPFLDLQSKAHKDLSSKTNEFFGPAQQLGLGVVRSSVTIRRDGTPQTIGVRISKKSFESFPEEEVVLSLELPQKTGGLPFDHISLNWNPQGHEPDGIYTLPHFDVHFYMISVEEQMQITDPEKAANLPSPEEIPTGYFIPGAPSLVPYMGVHWLSHDAPELPPTFEKFTHTFIYGSYDGDFIFMEPMITVEYLENEADGTPFPFTQPEKYPMEGFYYPTNYSMSYDSQRKEYLIEMAGMVWRE